MGPRTIRHRLGRDGLTVPGRSSIYRCLVRHGLITPQARKRKRSDYKRWERSRSMELWQMDIVGGVRLAGGAEAKIVSGIDDHSRFCVSALVVARATARPTCEALTLAMARYGVPNQILTDNGKVFTNRFGPGTADVLFDRICRDNGIRHLLTAPRSPTTTGKVERWHRTLRREFLDDKVFADIPEAQAALDAWVKTYNCDRPHQGIGMVAPWERFRLAAERTEPLAEITDDEAPAPTGPTRRADRVGTISFAGVKYKVGRWLAGEQIEVTCDAGLVHLHHRGVLIATHAQRHSADKQVAGLNRNRPAPPAPRPTPQPRTTPAAPVTRKVDSAGNVSFAGTPYSVGPRFKRRQVQVTVVGDEVEIWDGPEFIRAHPIRHDRSREFGALATPGGRPKRINAA